MWGATRQRRGACSMRRWGCGVAPHWPMCAFESFAQAEIARLEELRVAALEERIDARLSEGEHALVVAELEQLSAEHPSRERLIGLLMLALYRSGRQTDALAVYTRGRMRLDEELGLKPSPQLQRLQEAILRHDPALDARETATATRSYHGQAPEGVLTMLFTDIEGSTRLARLGPFALWPQVLAEHHALVLDAVERAGGHVAGKRGRRAVRVLRRPQRGSRGCDRRSARTAPPPLARARSASCAYGWASTRASFSLLGDWLHGTRGTLWRRA